ncbi:hypothetical protein BaRGS_00029403 [Batillaria attramentaria]|uniref:Uncharacterized protein n=1 Tax=Batillaria attramentaria TaxID=370345 RepID=A0ABD0JXE3_9CAEN
MLHLKSIGKYSHALLLQDTICTRSLYGFTCSRCNGYSRSPSGFQRIHVLRRSDLTDLVIEQVLMRSVWTAGGLTHGRGMGESQRNQWLLSMPAYADMNDAMQEFTSSEFTTSDQNTESGETRQKRDENILTTMSEAPVKEFKFNGRTKL